MGPPPHVNYREMKLTLARIRDISRARKARIPCGSVFVKRESACCARLFGLRMGPRTQILMGPRKRRASSSGGILGPRQKGKHKNRGLFVTRKRDTFSFPALCWDFATSPGPFWSYSATPHGPSKEGHIASLGPDSRPLSHAQF